MLWISHLFLLVFSCATCICSQGSLAAVLDPGLQNTNPCIITSPFNSPLIHAYQEQEVTSSGCVTNATMRTGGEVHIISYHSDRDQNLELNLVDFQDNGFEKPFVIILSSNTTVHWQVRIKNNPKDLSHHTFVVSKGSGLRFANKKLKSRPSILKPKTLPTNDSALMSWVVQRYHVITSFTNLSGGNWINLLIGKTLSSLHKPSTNSVCSIQDGHQVELTANATARVKQTVDGCIIDKHTAHASDYAYVIELNNTHQKKGSVVDLVIRRKFRYTTHKKYYLVLRSAEPVTWRIHTEKDPGFLSIVVILIDADKDTASFVDMKYIHHETKVNVRSEELQHSGVSLIQWIEFYVKPVAMYTTMNNTNKIELSLPQMDASSSLPEPVQPPMRGPEWGTLKHKRLTLERALRTDCNENYVTVAVDKNVLQMLRIHKSTVTLKDSQCTAQENSTHIYIITTGNACGTNYMDGQHGKMAYINTLVIHNSGSISDRGREDDALETEGSGFEDLYSGSGDRDPSDIMLDDEDLELRPLQINFICKIVVENHVIPNISPPFSNTKTTKTGLKSEPQFELELYQSMLYLEPYARSPIDVVHPQGHLYVQATETKNPALRAYIQHCWLSHVTDKFDENKHSLVKNGCVEDSTVEYPPVPVLLQHSQRLVFSLKNYGKLTTSPEIYLKCHLTVCCIDRDCGGYNYPLCTSMKCDRARNTIPQAQLETPPSRLVILGPINLPQDTDTYETLNPDTTDLGTNSDSPKQGGSSGDKQDHVVIQGLDSPTVVGIAFAAFIIGVLMMGALWFIHTHSVSIFTSGPFKRSQGNRGSTETEADYGETTPGSSAPIST